MIAEIHGKWNDTRNDLHRIEDQLTGDMFGTFQYMPLADGLAQMLGAAEFHGSGEPRERFLARLAAAGKDDKFTFWPRGKHGEMDVLVETERDVICIEVKYRSGLSSEDQLHRYAAWLQEIGRGKHRTLLFAAPASTAIEVKQRMEENPLPQDVRFGTLTWEDALERLREARRDAGNIFYERMFGNLCRLLETKGFVPFRGFVAATGEASVTLDAYEYGVVEEDWPDIDLEGVYTYGERGA